LIQSTETFDDDGELTFVNKCARNGVIQRISVDLLVLFRELSTDDNASVAEGGGAHFEGFSDSVGGFEEGEGEGGFGERGEDFCGIAGFAGKKTEESESLGVEAGDAKGGGDGTWAGDGFDFEIGGGAGVNKIGAGVAESGGAGIGEEDGEFGAFDLSDEGGNAVRRGVIVEELEGWGDFEMAGEGAADAGVFDDPERG